MAVRLRLPAMLEPVIGRREMTLEGPHVAAVLEAAFERAPVLRHHVMDDDGTLRVHVLCLHNGVNLEREPLARVPVTDGDELEIVQAISGG